MLSLHVTVNYPTEEKEYDVPFHQSQSTLGDSIRNIIATETEATSFVFVVSKVGKA